MKLRPFYRNWILSHAALTLVLGSLIYFSMGRRETTSLVLGAIVMGISLGVLVIAMARILEKKHVAVYGSLIVIKYAIFGILAYRLSTAVWLAGEFLTIWFGLGLLIGVLSLSLNTQHLQE